MTEGDRYAFLYVTDSLLVRVLGGLRSAEGPTKLAHLAFRGALLGQGSHRAHGGASYGYQLFTWSTSRVVSAISAAAAFESEFPERPAEYSGTKARPVLTAVVIAILLLSTRSSALSATSRRRCLRSSRSSSLSSFFSTG